MEISARCCELAWLHSTAVVDENDSQLLKRPFPALTLDKSYKKQEPQLRYKVTSSVEKKKLVENCLLGTSPTFFARE